MRIDIIELGSADEDVVGGGPTSAFIRAAEGPVVMADGNRTSEAYATQIAPPGPELALGLAPAPAQIQLAA